MAWSRRCSELLLLLLLLLLAGCVGTSTQMAPVERPGAADYVVRKGDNLYGIAFQRGVTVQDIVSWNHIANPDLIHPGQRLRLAPPMPGGRVVPVRRSRPVVVVTGPRPVPVISVKRPLPAVTAPRRPVIPPAVASKPASVRTPLKVPVKPAPRPAANMIPLNLPTRRVDGVRWAWPSKGRIIKGFSASSEGKKGINIAAPEGQAVVAAASGKIVYAGSGLGGYGKLIIIEHNKKYLSAYAHNSVLKAKEGDRVTIGQTIAAMGKTGTSRVMLHFEIRRDGKAVDPVRYLPAQNP